MKRQTHVFFRSVHLIAGLMLVVASSNGCADKADFGGESAIAKAFKPTCQIQLTSDNVTLGQSVKASVQGDFSASSQITINNIPTDTGRPVELTPNEEGLYAVTAHVKQGQTNTTCLAAVSVVAPDEEPNPETPPSCSVLATRQSAGSITCNLTVTSTGGALIEDPKVPNEQLQKNSQREWNSIVPCPASGKSFTASVTGNNGSSNTCQVTVPAIIPTACKINTSVQKITLGQSFGATMEATGGPWETASINGTAALPGKMISFTPSSAGVFQVMGVLTNAAGTNNCETSVTVEAPSIPIVVPPSCSISATRNGLNSSRCDLVVTSTGGTIIGDPAVQNAAQMTRNGNQWMTSTACATSGQKITAVVSGLENKTAQCSTDIGPINTTACVRAAKPMVYDFSIARHKDSVTSYREQMPKSDVETSVLQRFNTADIAGDILPVTAFALDDVAFIVKESDNFPKNGRTITIPPHALIIKDGRLANGASGKIDSAGNTIYRYKDKSVTITSQKQNLADALNKIASMGITPINHNQIRISDLRARGFVDAGGNVTFKVVHVAHGHGFISMKYTLNPCQ